MTTRPRTPPAPPAAPADAAAPHPDGDSNQRIAAAAVAFFTNFSRQFAHAVQLQTQLLALLGEAQGQMLHVLSATMEPTLAHTDGTPGAPFGIERRKSSVVINFPDRRARRTPGPAVRAS